MAVLYPAHVYGPFRLGMGVTSSLLPNVSVNCLLFPAWVRDHSADDLREELRRLMKLGRAFPEFSFSLWEIDMELADDKIFVFHEIFRQCGDGPINTRIARNRGNDHDFSGSDAL